MLHAPAYGGDASSASLQRGTNDASSGKNDDDDKIAAELLSGASRAMGRPPQPRTFELHLRFLPLQGSAPQVATQAGPADPRERKPQDTESAPHYHLPVPGGGDVVARRRNRHNT